MENDFFKNFIAATITIFFTLFIINIGAKIIVDTHPDINSDTNTSESANIMTEEKDLTLSELLLTKAEEKLESLEKQMQAESEDKNTDEKQNMEESSDEFTILDAILIFSLLLISCVFILPLLFCEDSPLFFENIIELCGDFFMRLKQFFAKKLLFHTLNKENKRYNKLHIDNKEISLKISLLQAGIKNICYDDYFCPELDELLPTKITNKEILKKGSVAWEKCINGLYGKQGMSPKCMKYSIFLIYRNYYSHESLPELKSAMEKLIGFIHADIDQACSGSQPSKKKKDVKAASGTPADVSGLVLYQQQILSFIRTCPDDYAQIWAEILSQIKMLQNIMAFKKANYLEGIGNIEFRIENAIEKFNNYLNLKNFEGAINSTEFENLNTHLRTYLKNTAEMLKKANQDYMSSDVNDLDVAIRAGLISEDGELKYYKKNISM